MLGLPCASGLSWQAQMGLHSARTQHVGVTNTHWGLKSRLSLSLFILRLRTVT